MTPAHSITHESVTVVLDGRTFTVRKSSPNFEAARAAAFNGNWNEIQSLASPGHAIEQWLGGDFTLNEGFITYKDIRIDADLNDRLKALAAEGGNPSGWLKFWTRLQANPSHRSVTQLYAFLTHENVPIDEDTGFILAYKSVTAEYKDFHTKTYDNSPGSVLEMPRNQISDDPAQACHFGFHVGAIGYASGFGSDRRIVIVRVDPADVVCVPYDCTAQKVRVCRYEVVGNYSGTPMPNTSTRDDADDLDADAATEEQDEPVEASGNNPLSDAEDIDWSAYDRMSATELDAVSIAVLRRYARFGLEIFGASKIPGGKAALIKRILEIRRKP